jgi:proline iminopeptidase
VTDLLQDALDVRPTGPKADRVVRVPVEGGRVVAYVYGDGPKGTLLAINGGPGVASEYLRRGLLPLVARGWRLVIHDQLGTGASDRPDDPGLWTLRRYVAEVEAVRRALCGGPVHLLGHSWGGWLGIEYAVTHPEALRSAVFSSTGASMPVHMEEIRRLMGAFGEETVAMVDRLEDQGRFDSPLYKAFCTLFYARHSSRRAYRLGVWTRSDVNMGVQTALWGPAEFRVTGELRDWNRLPYLARVAVPCLVTVGAYDYLTPREAALIQAHLPDARLVVFAESGHEPMQDEPERHAAAIDGFLEGVAARR